MAVDINKLINDAKTAQEAARAAAEAANKVAAKDKANEEVAALSKSQLKYADTLKVTLADYEARLKIFANKIARGDKLSGVEQKEFKRLQSDYKSVSASVDAAIKKANDILVEARRSKSTQTTPPPAATGVKTPTGPDAARLGVTPTTATKPEVKPETKLSSTPDANADKQDKTPPANALSTPLNAGSFRKGEEASMLGADGKTAGTKSSLDTLLAKTEFWYDLPDYIFKLDTKLGELLVEAVATDMKPEIFLSKAKLTPWWQRNSESVRTKIVNREKYNDLLKSGEDVKNTEYGMYLGKQMRAVKAQAKEIAGVTLTDEQAQSVAQKIYDGNLEDDPLAINALIVPFIGKTTSIVGAGTKQTGFGGQALQNYQTLQGIAKANGFSLKDILPNISAVTAGGDLETAVLRGLADGSIDINRVSQDARMLAAQGQPQYVRNLLSQGYDLEAVYAPYRRTMAAELELQPDEIDLNDSTLRMAITDKGDMNLYDFKKALRQDNRWQYTGTAKEEVSNAALKVLKDFGFQG
jgi:hypothetical protein